MTLDDRLLSLLTYRPEPADVLNSDARHSALGRGEKVDWQPGDILAALERLVLAGKATLVRGEGYRLPVDEPVKQRSMFG